ncbi:hypothetical protein BH09BAC6_BH09BAC6_01500 [soil metagenome]|jgi:hypothetical protein
MIKKIKDAFRILLTVPNQLLRLEKMLTEQKILAAKAIIASQDYSLDLPIANYEFKVFSQWGDDGIIQYLINRIDIPDKTFIEFGVENYTEANTLFLLANNNWRGFIMDGSKSNIQQVRNSELSWKYDLQTKDVFITTGNINALITESGFGKDVGILSIDIDGNDYWVWDAITVVSPIIVIVEFNSVFGPHQPWTIPYKPDFTRNEAHFSNLYFGCSLLSLCDLAEKKGYSFIGCNNAGNNAYFVRKDKIGAIKPLKAEDGYVNSAFKESRNREGYLTYVSSNARLDLLKGMPIFNTRSLQTEAI